MTPEQAAKDRSDLATALGGDWTVEIELTTLWSVTLSGLVATSPGCIVAVECKAGWWLLYHRPPLRNIFRGCVYRKDGIAALAARIRAIASEQEPRPV